MKNLIARVTGIVMTRRFVLVSASLSLAAALLSALTGNLIAAGAFGYLGVLLVFLVFWHGLMTANRNYDATHGED